MSLETQTLEGVAHVIVRGDRIDIKELKWKVYLRAVRELTGTLLSLFGDGITNGKLELNKDRLVAALTEQEHFLGWLVAESTGRSKEWVDDLRPHEMLLVLDKILDLNLTEETGVQAKKLGARMRTALGIQLNMASSEPSISLSPKATA